MLIVIFICKISYRRLHGAIFYSRELSTNFLSKIAKCIRISPWKDLVISQSRSLTSAYGNPRSAFSSYFVRSPYYVKPGHAAVQSVSREIGNSLKISRFPQIIYVFCNSNESLRAEIAEIVSTGERKGREKKERRIGLSWSWSRVPGQTLYRVT